ncbi:hypothetical protein PMIN04_012372 [Paraphaeosphaeria minitans]|uniref:Uncharacterized protein n=1 Tax=Paraphaeosphaeria minitans TaxID=565426 RepID=A0A9P6G443_9PLEO|nr:hypothetical protein PMIN01_13590 [Paraphaeosphaeria minitans]
MQTICPRIRITTDRYSSGRTPAPSGPRNITVTDKAHNTRKKSTTRGNKMPYGFQKWLLEKDAQNLIQRPIEEIEFLFQPFLRRPSYSVNYSDTFDTGPRPFRVPYTKSPPYDGKDALHIQLVADACYALTHENMLKCTDVGIKMWGLGHEEAVQLLFNIEEIFNPIYRLRDGTEDEERKIFGTGRVHYWPELRKALGYQEWGAEQMDE